MGIAGNGNGVNSFNRRGGAFDVFVLLIAWRYGTLDAEAGISLTHKEYRKAQELGLPILAYLADPVTYDLHGPYGNLFPLEVRQQGNEALLLAFREEVEKSGRVVEYFTTPDDLSKKIATDLGKFLARRRESVAAAQHIRAVPLTLPPPVADFVGREQEIAQIEEELAQKQHVVIAGMGGLGKSALASAVVHRLAHDDHLFPGGMTWVACNELRGWEGMSVLAAQLLRAWNITVPSEELHRIQSPQQEVEFSVRILRERLASYGPSFVLLDNVELELPLKDLLDFFTSSQITALITTRVFFSLPMLRLRRLAVLDADDAQLLLCERYQAKGGEWEDARDAPHAVIIVESLGYLPLAIELAAARAARLNQSIEDLANELQQPGFLTKLQNATDAHSEITYILGQTLNVLSAHERLCFDSLGLFDKEEYPLAVVTDLFGAFTGQSGTGSFEHTLDMLITLSLVSLKKRHNVTRLYIHPLLHEIAVHEWKTRDQATHLMGLVGACAGLTTYGERYAQDFVALAEDEQLFVQALRQAKQTQEVWGHIPRLIALIDPYLDLQGRWNARNEILDIQLYIAHSQGNPVLESQTLRELGALAIKQHKYEQAIHHLAEALDLARQSKDDSGESSALRHLGNVEMTRVHYPEALRYYQKALVAARKGHARSEEGKIVGNLGYLASAQGQHAEAISYFEQALAIARSLGDQVEEGNTLSNLGEVMREQGEFSSAAHYLEQYLAISRALGNIAQEGKALSDLGNLALSQAHFPEARSLYEQALEPVRNVGDLLLEGWIFYNLGNTAMSLDEYQEAAAFYDQALTRGINLENKALEGYTFSSLGELQQHQGDLPLAAQYYERALPLLKTLNKTHAAVVRQSLQELQQRLSLQHQGYRRSKGWRWQPHLWFGRKR